MTVHEDAVQAAAEAAYSARHPDLLPWHEVGPNEREIWLAVARAAASAAAPILLADAQAGIERLREVVSLALGVIDLDMKLHAPSASTAGCGGGIGGAAITPHCPDYCDHPKHDADKARREDLLRDLYLARIAETAPEETK